MKVCWAQNVLLLMNHSYYAAPFYYYFFFVNIKREIFLEASKAAENALTKKDIL